VIGGHVGGQEWSPITVDQSPPTITDRCPPSPPAAHRSRRRRFHMSVVDDLIENLVERNAVQLGGTFTISLIDGGINVKGTVLSTVNDQKKNKSILNVSIPVDATVKVGDIVIPLPNIK
jgi:hypothetical protein